MFGYFWNPELADRKVGLMCPEVPERYRALSPDFILNGSGKTSLFQFGTRGENILTSVHEAGYIDEVRTAYSQSRRFLDSGDTMVTANIFDHALLAASAGCEALDRILTGEIASAFCAIRPPGHHANRMRALGFCVFNNAAVAARYARSRYGVGRVLIVDWDVHPGNGTQEIFWEDPSVFTLSFHQADLFADAGRSELVGEGAGKGFNRNLPLKPSTDPIAYLSLFERVVQEVADRFRPELLVISAGFDAHERDLVSQLKLTEDHFGRMTELVLEATRPFTGGRTLSLLEGGYNPSALRHSVTEHCRVLAAAG